MNIQPKVRGQSEKAEHLYCCLLLNILDNLENHGLWPRIAIYGTYSNSVLWPSSEICGNHDIMYCGRVLKYTKIMKFWTVDLYLKKMTIKQKVPNQFNFQLVRLFGKEAYSIVACIGK